MTLALVLAALGSAGLYAAARLFGCAIVAAAADEEGPAEPPVPWPRR